MVLNGKTPAEACGIEVKGGDLLKKSKYWQVIATEITCSVDAVKMKAKRLGLSVVVDRGRGSTTTNDLLEELPSVEEGLKVLASVCIGKK